MGRLANRPIQNEVRAAMAAVAVTRSRLTSSIHCRYSRGLSVMQLSLLEAGHTQLPPLSETIEASEKWSAHFAHVDIQN
jgi:hypothetical protein